MKKIKNLLLIVVLTVFTALLPNYVSAAPSANNFKVYCGKSAISFGETASCFLLAQITEDGGQGIYGVYAGIQSTDKLAIQGSDVMFPDMLKSTMIPKGNQRGDGKACDANNNCYDFVALDGKTILNKAGQNITDKYPEINQGEWQGYTVIGFWTVKLEEGATDENCGKLCVLVDYKATKENSTATAIDRNNVESLGCAEIHPIAQENPKICVIENGTYYDKNGNVVTEEEYKKQCSKTCVVENGTYYDKNGNIVTEEEYNKQCNPPETGSFASYAVLAAGAFIALSAITIAKKHNKFYRV